MNLDELRTVQSKERRKDSLQHLRDSFYGDVAEYIAGLKQERTDAAERADDPFSSPEVSRLSDEIETAEEVIEAVYERRVGKVVKLASFAAADMPVDEDGMTAEEKALFKDLVARIETNKTNVLDILAGKRASETTAGKSPDGSRESSVPGVSREAPDTSESTNPSPSQPTADDGTPTDAATGDPTASVDSTETGGVLANAMGGGDESVDDESVDDGDDSGTGHTPVEPEPAPPGSAPTDEPAEGQVPDESAATDAPEQDDTERTTVRITQDVGAIFGVDEREYDLAKEDVVTLPAANADPLIEREAAERLD